LENLTKVWATYNFKKEGNGVYAILSGQLTIDKNKTRDGFGI
jgi:hypothetical protein